MSKSARRNMHLKTRNGSPSPLLLSPRDMERAIIKERMRCDRYHQYFAMVVLQVNKSADLSNHKQARILAKLLRKRLRLTDEIGMLLKGGIGVLLPMTDIHGATNVRNWILMASESNGLSVEADVFTYSGHDEFNAHDGDSHTTNSDSDIGVFVHQETIVETDSSNTTRVTTLERLNKPIRADDHSQVRTHATSTKRVDSSDYFCVQYPAWKRSSDIVGALIGLTFASPVLILAGVAIKLNSKGPIFFRQLRTGQHGRSFPIYKLRTMVMDAESMKSKLQELNERDGPAFKMKDDPRVTSVGKLLRKTGIDELPQLWNVLIGDMALVGPRPLPCNEDSQCEIWQRRRLDTKPGLTCTWQISKSRKVSFDDWMRMDLRYTRKRSIATDLGLLFKTVFAVVTGKVGH